MACGCDESDDQDGNYVNEGGDDIINVMVVMQPKMEINIGSINMMLMMVVMAIAVLILSLSV